MKSTVIIPNYKTPMLTKLCLRSLRKFTDLTQTKIIVVDNDSADASLEYLKRLKWITLIERKTAGETGPEMHARALDTALEAVDTPFFAVMHTDTIVRSEKWLDFLLGKFDGAPKLGGVGSWKLEHISRAKVLGQRIEDFVRELFTRRRHAPEERYLRSHCAVYRTELVKKFTRGFDDHETAGKSLHRMLVAAGFEMRFLESAELGQYVDHLNHATMILNPVGSGRTSKASSRRKLDGKLDNQFYRKLLEDETLDGL
jgi:hypothetical protein